jgi:hypothetical protein
MARLAFIVAVAALTTEARAATYADTLAHLEDGLTPELAPPAVEKAVAELRAAGRRDDARLVATLLPIAWSESDPGRAMDLAAQAFEDAQALRKPRRAYEVALFAARAGRRLKAWSEALGWYDKAAVAAEAAARAGAFGSSPMALVLPGAAGPAALRLPGGFEYVVAVAREASEVADAAGRPREAVAWVARMCAVFGRPPDPILFPPQMEQLEMEQLEKLARRAREEGRADDARAYEEAAARSRAAAEERSKVREARVRSARAWGMGLAVALAAAWLGLLVRFARPFLMRRRAGPRRDTDAVRFTAARVLEVDARRRPSAWRSTAWDLLGRMAFDGLLFASAAAAGFGAAALARLAWVQTEPDRPVTSLGLPLLAAGPMAAWACFVLLVQGTAPTEAVRREVRIRGSNLLVRTRTGLFAAKVVDEAVPLSIVQRIEVRADRAPVAFGALTAWLVVVHFPGRALVVGGAGTREQAEALAAGLSAATRVPLSFVE